MQEYLMKLNKMIDVLVYDKYILDREDHSLVMHDLYLVSAHNKNEGEKGLVDLLEAYRINLRVHKGYKEDKEALKHINEILYNASLEADKIIGNGSTLVKNYFIDTIAKIENGVKNG